MELTELQNKIANNKKGTFTSATWRSEKNVNGVVCEKVSKGVVRLVKYENINGVVVKGKVNKNNTMVSSFIKYNDNTKRYSVMLGTTEIKPMVTYKVNGVVVDKATFETYVKPNKPRLDANGNVIKNVVFSVYIENLLDLD